MLTSPVPSAPPQTSLPDVLEFLELLWAVVHGVETRSRRMSTHIGVTGKQRLVLRIVGLFPDRPAGELARILHIHPSTLTVLAQRLIGQGLLRRTEGLHDRRRVMYSLTARGARINATHEGTVESAVEAALRGVTAEQRAATRHVLLRIADHLLQAVPKPAPPRRRRGSSPRRASPTNR